MGTYNDRHHKEKLIKGTSPLILITNTGGIRDTGSCKDKGKKNLVASSKLLRRHSNSRRIGQSFNYRSVVGTLQTTWTKRTNTVHCKCCSPVCKIPADLRQEHGNATRWLAKYLKETYGKVMSHSPAKEWNLEAFGTTDFAETGTQKIKIRQGLDKDTLLAGCPILWKSW
jgi:hypothetical protein